MIISKQIIFF